MKTSSTTIWYPGKISTPFDKLYVPGILSRVSFPHRDPGTSTYLALDNKYVFCIESGHKFLPEEKKMVKVGVPFGIYPRLLLSLIATYAVYYKEREIVLSKNLSEFIKSLGYSVTGGKGGTINQLNRQLQKLLNCRMVFLKLDKSKRKVLTVKKYLNHIDRIEIWESLDRNETSPNPVKAILSESFYNRIQKTAFPVNHNTVEALRSSLLALDLYFFFCSRTARLKGKDAFINWSELEEQFGSNYKQRGEFVRNAKLAINKIQRWYPQLHISYKRGRLILKKTSKPHVKPIE